MRYLINADERIKLPDEYMSKFWKLPRFVYFSGEFNEESARKFREELEMAEDAALSAKQEIIPIIIDSDGGCVYSMFSMVDAIKACSLPVATIVEAKAMSAGVFLFSCGAEGHRYVSPSATIMIHAAASGPGGGGKVHESKANFMELDRLNDKAFKMLSENCGHNENYFWDLAKEKNLADWYLTAKEAKKLNIANHIGFPSIKVNITMDFKFGI